MALRVYIDTSVIGGCLDDEYAEHSLRVFDLARAGRLRLLFSDVVIRELDEAPSAVRELVADLPESAVEAVPITDEVARLRDAYIAALVVGERWTDDATHVAAATVAQADAIVSWNCRHIVRLDRIKQYNRVNRSLGFGELTIITPREVACDEPNQG